MQIEYDPAKRDEALRQRGLDMAGAAEVFSGPHLTIEDRRRDYGETRFVTIGYMRQRLCFIGWTPRAGRCRVFSIRKANAREIACFGPALGNTAE